MDKPNEVKSKISKHETPVENSADQEVKKSRLPVKIHPSKKESSGSVITSTSAPVKSKLPVRKSGTGKNENEGNNFKTKAVSSKRSRIPTISPRVSAVITNIPSKNQCCIISDQSLKQSKELEAEDSGTNCLTEKTEIEESFPVLPLASQIEPIISQDSQEIDLPFLDEEPKTLKTDSFYAKKTLEQRIHENIRGIKNSLINSDLNPDLVLEHKDTQKPALDDMFSKFDFNLEFKTLTPVKTNDDIIAKANTDIADITSCLKIDLEKKVSEISSHVLSCLSQKLPKPSSVNISISEDFLQSECANLENVISENHSAQEKLSSDLKSSEITNLKENEPKTKFEGLTDCGQSQLMKESKLGLSEELGKEESDLNKSKETDEILNTTTDKQSQDIVNSEQFSIENDDLTEAELVEHIKDGLVELKSQIILSSEEAQPFGSKTSESVSTATDEIEKCMNCGYITSDGHRSDVDEVTDPAPCDLLDKSSRDNAFIALGDLMTGKDFTLTGLTTEFIKFVRADMSVVQSEPMHPVSETKRYEFLRLLNELEDLVSETKKSSTELSLKKLPLSRESGPSYGARDESEETFSKVLQALDCLDDYSNEKLEDLMELSKSVVKSKIPSMTLSKAKIPPEIRSLHNSLKAIGSKTFGETNATGSKNSKTSMKLSNSDPMVKLNSKFSKIFMTISSPSTFKGGSYKNPAVERMNKNKPPVILPTPASSNEKQNSNESETLLILHRKLVSNQLWNSTNKKSEPKILEYIASQLKLANQISSNSIESVTADGLYSYPAITKKNETIQRGLVDPARLPNKYNVFSLPMLPEKILKWWDTKSMLSGRGVCREWAAGITNSSVFRKKIVVLKPMDVFTTWEALQTSTFYQFNHPNICVMRNDLREPSAMKFFHQNCSTLKHLSLEHCMFSLATLQQLILNCVHLEHFQIQGFPEYILFSEKIFPFTNPPPCLTELKTLILNSFGREPSVSSLSLGFISHFINSSTCLERIELIGWKSMTATNFLKLLMIKNPILNKVTRLSFSGIPLNELDMDHFIILALAPHNLKLRSLELSFAEPQTVFTRGRDYANLIMREIVRLHSKTLEELNLTNCPITEEIFIFLMPKLRKLSLCGTNISNTEFQLKMPNLEELKVDISRNCRLSTSQNATQDYYGPDDWYHSNTCIFLSWLSCLSICPMIYYFNPASAGAGLPFFLMGLVAYLMVTFSDSF